MPFIPAALDRSIIATMKAVLTPHLGQYRKPDGSVQPAIYEVRNRGHDPPDNWRKVGLECLIFPPTNSHSLNFGSAQLNGEWEIRLIQHDRAGTIESAYEAILAASIPVKYRSHFSQTDEKHEQLNLSLYSYRIINQ